MRSSKLVVIFLITAVLFGGLPAATSADSPVPCSTRGQAATDTQGRSLLCSSSCKKQTGLPLAWVVKGSCALSAPATQTTTGGTAAPTAVPPQPERPPEPPTAAPTTAAGQTTAGTKERTCVSWFLIWCTRYEGADAPPTPTALAPVPVPLPTPPLGTPQPADQADLRDWGFNPGDVISVVSLGATIYPGHCPVEEMARAFWGHVVGRRTPEAFGLVVEAINAAAARGVDIYATKGSGAILKITVRGVQILFLTGVGAPPTAFDAPSDKIARELKGATKRKPTSPEAINLFKCLAAHLPQSAGEWEEAKRLADREYNKNSRFALVGGPVPAPIPVLVAPPEGSTRTNDIFVPGEVRGLSDQEIAGLVTAGVLIFVGVVTLSGGGAALVFAFAAF